MRGHRTTWQISTLPQLHGSTRHRRLARPTRHLSGSDEPPEAAPPALLDIEAIREKVIALSKGGDEPGARALLLSTPPSGRQVEAHVWHHRVVNAWRASKRALAPHSAEALAVHREMLRRGVRVAPETHAVAMAACMPGRADLAVVIFRENYGALRLSRAAWLALLNALGSSEGPARDSLRAAHQELLKLQKVAGVCVTSGPRLDAQMYGALIQASARSRDVGGAHGFLEEMRRAGLPPASRDVTMLVSACAATGNTRIASDLLADLQKSHPDVLDAHVLSASPQLFCGDAKDAAKVSAYFGMFGDVPIPPNACVTVLRLCRDAGAVGSARVALQHTPPTRRNAKAFMQALGLARDHDSVGIDFAIEVMAKMGEARDVPAWMQFFAVHQKKRAAGVLRFVHQMEAEGLPRPPTLLRIAKMNCEDRGEFEDAEAVRDEAHREGFSLRTTLF